MNRIRRAEMRDIPAILELLVQVDMVHHNGRPDLFRGPATKYNAEELKEILADEKMVRVYNLNGQLIMAEDNKSINEIQALLSAGVYIVNGKKLIIK